MTGSSTTGVVSMSTRATRARLGASDDQQLAGSSNSGGGIGTDKGRETRSSGRRCSQCARKPPCNHQGHPDKQQQQHPSSSPAHSPSAKIAGISVSVSGPEEAHALPHPRPRRLSKLKHRANNQLPTANPPSAVGPSSSTTTTTITTVSSSLLNQHINNAVADTSNSSSSSRTRPSKSTRRTRSSANQSAATMEPPVLSFYGTEPVPLPSRFAQIKRSLTAGHETELEASWARLLAALKDEVDHIESSGPQLIPSIDFTAISDASKTAEFALELKRYGVGVVKGVVPRADAQEAVADTARYLAAATDFKAPPPQDPTCFDFFWTPAQVRMRAHPNVLRAQRFAMGMWDADADDRMATRFPIAYADRLRVHGATLGGVTRPGPKADPDADEPMNGTSSSSNGGGALDAQKAAAELLGDFTSSTVIAQVDNGSLERWEPDGYGREGTYEAVFKGSWENYDPWDPTFRVSATPDLYNGYGACSIFRMYQGVIALNTIEPGMIRLLPSPKLATAYFLLRPFFSPKVKAPEVRSGPEWEAFLDVSNWSVDRAQSTIILGAVPGHAQRLTERWHPHLHLRRTLITIPTLQAGDYIMWHPDLAYHITSNGSIAASRAATPPLAGTEPSASSAAAEGVSVLVYVPACPLTQTNALYLARQRKTFQRGHPGPDFDATGSGLGSEATHPGRPGETEIANVGQSAGLQAMGLAPFDVAPTPPGGLRSGTGTTTATESSSSSKESNGAVSNGKKVDEDVDMDAADEVQPEGSKSPSSCSHAEAEVARLANIILFPDRYDFYMAKRNGASTPRVKTEKA